MSDLARALSAELLKTRRTLSLWLVLAAPGLTVAMMFGMFISQLDYFVGREMDRSIWLSMTQNVLMIWTILAQPLYITLQTALNNQLEHANAGWRHLYSLPLHRGVYFLSKGIVSAMLVGLSNLVLIALVVGAGLLLQIIEPRLGFTFATIPWRLLLLSTGFAYASSLLILFFHHWISANWSNFVVAMGVGIATAILSVMLVESDWLNLYPWSVPAYIVMELLHDKIATTELLVCSLGGIVLAGIGCGLFARRDAL